MRWFRIVWALAFLITLSFGLYPKGYRFRNEVFRIEGAPGLRFGKFGLAFTDPGFTGETARLWNRSGFTVEICLDSWSGEDGGFRYIALFYNGDDASQLLLGQWRNYLVWMNGDDYDHKRKEPRIAMDLSEFPGSKHFVGMTSGPGGVTLYCNGRRILSDPEMRLKLPEGQSPSRLLLGNSPEGKHPWQAEALGFAMFPFVLDDPSVQAHYQEWRAAGNFSFARKRRPCVLFVLNQFNDGRALDDSGFRRDLRIPIHTAFLHRAPFLRSIGGVKWDRSFAFDFVLNLFGFIPLGAASAASAIRRHGESGSSSLFVVLLLGFTASFLIEYFQSWMPSRSSSWIDLTLNTMGAALGWAVFQIWKSRN